jgi:hypothetical protein
MLHNKITVTVTVTLMPILAERFGGGRYVPCKNHLALEMHSMFID